MKGNTQQLFLPLSDANIREHLIFDRDYDPADYSAGGTCRFEELSFQRATELMERGYLSPYEKQNDAPTTQEFIDFMAAHDPDNWTILGYAVSPERYDVRVCIDGIRSTGALKSQDMVDFLRIFHTASKLAADDDAPVFCWYD